MSRKLRGRRIAIVGGSETSAVALTAALERAGAHPRRLPRPDGRAAILPGELGQLDGIVDLNLEDPLDIKDPRGWEQPLHQSIALLQACYGDWVAESDTERLCYVAVTRLGGWMGFADSLVSQPLGGLWAGLAKGLPREIPNCNVKVIDLAPEHEPDMAELVCRELYRWGLFEVGYRAGRRYTLLACPAPVPPPRLILRPGDAVVMSGGGRGIGFALARSLAADFGCRVIVSGRSWRPDPDAPVMRLGAEEFRRYRDDRLREAASRRELPAALRELARCARERELSANLSRARAEGLDIEYVQCDVTDREDVVRLVDRAGDRLVGVVHNAGVDVPARLPAKTPAVVTDVVGVKISGFLNLLAAVQGRPGLAFFCSVGSLTGRWGGMVGQLDYGAGNEGLSRLGLWASQADPQPGLRQGVPVVTVCWPTWERLGMVTNYEATLRYMSAVDVAEGLSHWQRELLAAEPGEYTFLGEVGPAMVPALLRGYPHQSSLPGIERLVSQRFFLGQPRSFRAFESISSDNTLRPYLLPCADDFRVDGQPALPASLCLELLVSVGEWVLPEQRDQLTLHEVRNVAIELSGLRLDGTDGTTTFLKSGAGRWEDKAWHVSVVLSKEDRQVARAELVYRPGGLSPEPVAPRQLAAHSCEPVDMPAAGERLRWSGHVFRLARWRRHGGAGSWCSQVDADHAGDLFAVWPAPQPALGLTVVENVVRAGYLRQVRADGKPEPGRLCMDRLVIRRAATAGGRLLGDHSGRDWISYGAHGEPQLRVEGLTFEAHNFTAKGQR